MNNIEEQKSAEQVVIENKLNRINEQNSDVKKYVEKEEHIRRLTNALKKSNVLSIVPLFMAILGIISMLLPIFINKSSMSVWKFIFDYGIPQKRINGFDLNTLDFSVYGNAFYEFVHGEKLTDIVSFIRGIEIIAFCICSAWILLDNIVKVVRYIFIINSNAETRIRQHYDFAARKNNFRSEVNGKEMPESMTLKRKKVGINDILRYAMTLIFPVSFGIFLEDWFQGFMHISVFYYVLPVLFFIGAIAACVYANKYNKENAKDIIEATSIYNAKF